MIAEVQSQLSTDVQRRLFTMEEFTRLWESGILNEGERVEFLDGELIAMSVIGGRHIRCINRFDKALQRLDDPSLEISVQNPLQIGDRASFLPDIVVLRPKGVSNDVPTADEALLAVEVADSSRNYDRNVKLPRYAAAGIPESWLCDLAAERIERHSEPTAEGYRQIRWAGRGETLTSTILPGLILEIDAILGPPETRPQGA
jgi:Uma2 family endonuclease